MTFAFFGATGGCTNAALVCALNAGHDCVAMARTPTKLHDMLLAKGVTEATMDSQLKILKGDINDAASVKNVLQGGNTPVTRIVNGIGMVFSIKGADSQICQKTARVIIQALEELQLPTKPLFITISTTGISNGPRDVPVLFGPMYHIMLKIPHTDKTVMEREIVEAAGRGSGFGGYVLVRPSLLTNGAAKPVSSIKVGSEEKPVVGYTISRDSVGAWIFEKLLKEEAKEWYGTKPSISS